jgi:hypothetical protein
MNRCWHIAAVLLGLAAGQPALGCRIYAAIDLKDVRYADLVVVGRVANYRIVRDMEFRRKSLVSPNLPADMRRHYESGETLLPDYARFDILVDEVLAGQAPKKVSVTWDNSTFAEPETMAPGPFLIALRRPRSALPPLRGPSATILPNREPNLLTLLQAPCARAFLFESGSSQAGAVRAILQSGRR